MTKEHSNLTGIELHTPFVSGVDGAKTVTPVVGQWYYAIDTRTLYSCYTVGVWTTFLDAELTMSGDGTNNSLNLIRNGSFEYFSLGTSSVPDYWALEGSPTIARDTGDIGYGSYSVKITATGAHYEGISYTLSGLKASTTYSVLVRTKATAGEESRMLTTGAGTNMAATDSSSTTFETKTGYFITDASGTSVVLKLMAKYEDYIVWFDGVTVCEGTTPFAYTDAPLYTVLGTNYGADVGSTDTYAVSIFGINEYITGMTLVFKANTINTGAATLNVNSLGVKDIVKGVTTPLVSSDILADMLCTVVYDGTNFVLMNPRAL